MTNFGRRPPPGRQSARVPRHVFASDNNHTLRGRHDSCAALNTTGVHRAARSAPQCQRASSRACGGQGARSGSAHRKARQRRGHGLSYGGQGAPAGGVAADTMECDVDSVAGGRSADRKPRNRTRGWHYGLKLAPPLLDELSEFSPWQQAQCHPGTKPSLLGISCETEFFWVKRPLFQKISAGKWVVCVCI